MARRGSRGFGVAGEFADDSGVGAGVGEMGAERVAQHVRGAAVLWQVCSCGASGTLVALDDLVDVVDVERAGAMRVDRAGDVLEQDRELGWRPSSPI
jgi:hypothetical protein